MSQSKKEKKLKFHKGEKWYYDANILTYCDWVTGEIINSKYRKALISHLALGEAIAGELIKGDEQVHAVLGLVNALKENDVLEIVNHDGIDSNFKAIREDSSNILSIMDAVHLATALHKDCNILRSIDPDLCNMQKKSLKNIVNVCCKKGKQFSIQGSKKKC